MSLESERLKRELNDKSGRSGHEPGTVDSVWVDTAVLWGSE